VTYPGTKAKIGPPVSRAREWRSRDDRSGILTITARVPILDFIAWVDDAALVITDSALQEETRLYWDRDCLTFRENTERPVTVLQGTNRLVALDPTPCCARRAPCSTMGAPSRNVPARAAPFLDGPGGRPDCRCGCTTICLGQACRGWRSHQDLR